MKLNNFKLSLNKKIAFSAISILSALAMLGGSAYATFTTNAVATANTFTTLNPSLTVGVNGSTAGQSVTGASVNGLIPGVAGTPQTFILNNTDATLTDPGLSVVLQLTADNTNTLPGSDLTIVVNCGAGNISDTYAGWISTGHGLGTLNPGQSLTCTMTPTLNSGIGNADLNTSAVFDATFTGSAGS